MQLHDPFPIEAFSARVRSAILDEFQGRCPTALEVASIPDTRWLQTPAIGPTTLAKIRSFTQELHTGGNPSATRFTDAELLAHRDLLHEELRRIETELRANRTELWMRGIYPPP